MWRQMSPALILTDLHMPVMDGYGMVRSILAAADGNAPPIIALTADANSEERKKCLAAGMAGYITKPVRAQVLKTALDKWIGAAAAEAAAGAVPPHGHEGRSLQYAIVEEMAGGDVKLINALLETFMRLAGGTEQVLRSAAAASDWGVLSEEAHKFKSSARTIGAVRLGELCEALETDCYRHDAEQMVTAVEELCTELRQVLAEVAECVGVPVDAVA
jgi:HPt (histidine-containing phosphotransfer) domain-containing protein